MWYSLYCARAELAKWTAQKHHYLRLDNLPETIRMQHIRSKASSQILSDSYEENCDFLAMRSILGGGLGTRLAHTMCHKL